MARSLLQKLWRHIRPEQLISLCITFVSALQAIIVVVWTGQSLATYISLVIGTTLTIGSDRVSRYIFENIAIKKMSYMKHKEENLECIGSLKQGLDWLIDNLYGAATVRNTVFTRSNRQFSSVDQKQLDAFAQSVSDCIKDGCDWHDAYVPQETAAVMEFTGKLNEAQRRKYSTYFIDTDIPMFQYTTIHYKSRECAVIFGWSYAGGKNETALVFVSRSKDTVGFFANHFERLTQSRPSYPDEPKKGLPVLPLDKGGPTPV